MATVKKKVYRNLGGLHAVGQDKNGKDVFAKKGETFESDEDLIRLYPNKFVLVDLVAEAEAKKKVEAEQKNKVQVSLDTAKAQAKNQKDTKEPNKKDTKSKDVTAQFPLADKNGLTVTKEKEGFNVFDGDEEPANEKPLSEEQVKKFLTDYLEE